VNLLRLPPVNVGRFHLETRELQHSNSCNTHFSDVFGVVTALPPLCPSVFPWLPYQTWVMKNMSLLVESKFSEDTDMNLIQANYVVSLFFLLFLSPVLLFDLFLFLFVLRLRCFHPHLLFLIYWRAFSICKSCWQVPKTFQPLMKYTACVICILLFVVLFPRQQQTLFSICWFYWCEKVEQQIPEVGEWTNTALPVRASGSTIYRRGDHYQDRPGEGVLLSYFLGAIIFILFRHWPAYCPVYTPLCLCLNIRPAVWWERSL
jgi:hypothetical protein